MKNKGLFSTLFIEDVKGEVELDDRARGRMATLSQTWQSRDKESGEALWNSFLKQAVSYLRVVPAAKPSAPGVYPLYEGFAFTNIVTILYLAEPGADLDDTTVGRFWPGKLVGELKRRKLNWGILTDGACWRLYSLKTAKPYEDFVELNLADALAQCDEAEYALFERFFHRDSFVKEAPDAQPGKSDEAEPAAKNREPGTGTDAHGVYKCRLDRDREDSEKIIEKQVKDPLLAQVDEILQYLCNGFIADTERKGTEYSEEERRDIFESAVKLLYRCLFLFYAEARSLLPSEPDKAEVYRKHSILNLCQESHRFKWGQRKDTDGYDLWKHLKGLINAVNDGDPEYGIMGYNGGLFDDAEERFLGKHKLRNDYLARALYLLAYVEPLGNEPEDEYPIPYADLEVRHLGELYENILEFNVTLADSDRIRRRTKKGVQIVLASETKLDPKTDSRIRKGDVFFGETALERKQTGSYYTPETLVHFLNQKAIINPLRERFDKDYRPRFVVFCKEAASGRDLSTRRGAAQSAIALVERFVEEVVLKFRACDPAMGSGHFLVNGANQITDLIVELLAEVPHVEGLKSRVSCSPNHWRRLVTRHCVYGVDLNPLAVHLAKLSLWLNCFARDHKLTFLDHHVKPGNSLIGIRAMGQMAELPERALPRKKAEGKQMMIRFPDELAQSYSQAVRQIEQIAMMDEDDTGRMKEMLEEAQKANATAAKLADLYTALLMDPRIDGDDYREIFTDMAKERSPKAILAAQILESVGDLKSRHHLFHWVLQFPEVFQGDNPGFDATTGNPPWDVLEPDSQEFYLAYDPDFRKLTKQPALRRIEELHTKHPAIADKWATFEKTFYEASAYCKESVAYTSLTRGKIDLYKAFLERFTHLLKKGGRVGIVCPSGFYTDESAMPLRALFLKAGRIECLYGFENRWPDVFKAVDNRFKFILMCFEKGASPGKFKCSFMQHDPERLPAIEAKALVLSAQQIKRFSPETLSFMELNTQRDADIITTIYGDHPHLGDHVDGAWNVQLSQEFNMSSDSHLFNTKGDGAPLYEGKLIAAFDHQYAPPNYWIAYDLVQNDEWSGRWRKIKKKKRKPGVFDYQLYRVGFRNIAASTNERAFIATVIPKGAVCPHTTLITRRLVPNKETGEPEEWINSAQTAWLGALFNSFVLDFVIRMKITNHLDMHFVYTLPVPRIGTGTDEDARFFHPILARCLRLVCTTDGFAPLWEELFDRRWLSPAFWYPKPGLTRYGPEHEQDVRKRLSDQVSDLTPKWTAKCGLHDRRPDRRDTGDRAQLRAEIDAYVAHLYCLSRDDFEYIFGTFPVLEKKERKAFGEFVSKRKCLEEYDRLAPIIREAK